MSSVWREKKLCNDTSRAILSVEIVELKFPHSADIATRQPKSTLFLNYFGVGFLVMYQ